MKEFDRISFPDNPDLKPLCKFKTHRDRAIIMHHTFDHLIVELKYDEHWNSFLDLRYSLKI